MKKETIRNLMGFLATTLFFILFVSGAFATEFVFEAGDSCELTSEDTQTRYGVKIFDFGTFESGMQYATGEVTATNTRKTEVCFSPRLMSRTAVTGSICIVNVVSMDSNQKTVNIAFDGSWKKICLVKAGDLRDGDLIDMNSTVDEIITKMVQGKIDNDETLWSYLQGKINSEIKSEFGIFRKEVNEDIRVETDAIVRNSGEINDNVEKFGKTTVQIQGIVNKLQSELHKTQQFIDSTISYALIGFICVMVAVIMGKNKRKKLVLSTGGN